jgi:hypothetical protein
MRVAVITVSAATLALAAVTSHAAAANRSEFRACVPTRPVTVLDHNGYTTCTIARRVLTAWQARSGCHVGDGYGAPQHRSCTVLAYRCHAATADDVPEKVQGRWTDAIGADVNCKRGRAIVEWEQVF